MVMSSTVPIPMGIKATRLLAKQIAPSLFDSRLGFFPNGEPSVFQPFGKKPHEFCLLLPLGGQQKEDAKSEAESNAGKLGYRVKVSFAGVEISTDVRQAFLGGEIYIPATQTIRDCMLSVRFNPD